MKLSSEIALEYAPEEIWSMVTDFASYPNWNPMVLKLEGDIKPLGNAQVTLAFAGGERLETQVEISGWVMNKYFSFVFKKGPTWWYQEEHVFRLRPRDDGKVVFFNETYATGMSLRFGRKSQGQRIGYAMDKMNEALKERLAEKK